jgi:hypothetical protein
MRGLACLVVLAFGCTSEPEGRLECDNLDESHCMLPFPSDYYRVGGKVDIPVAAMPKHREGKPIDPAGFKPDGWSTVTQIYFAMDGVTLTGTALGSGAIDKSIEPTSKTLIIDAQTGALHPHWVEFDYLSQDSGWPTVALRVAKPLEYGRRYVVAIRGLVDANGTEMPPTRGFKALRDGGTPPVVGIEDRRGKFESDVFAVTNRAGVDRSSLQLAWDFTTTREEPVTKPLLTARAKLMALIGDMGPEYTIFKVDTDVDGPNGNIAIKVWGNAKIPNFLEPKDRDGIKKLHLGSDGLPEPVGTVDVEFAIQIPRVALTSPTRSAVMQYGHGFLGRKAEADGGWLRGWANRHNFLVLQTDMEGMNEEAGITWFQVLPGDAGLTPHLSGWPFQGIMNHIALQRMMKGRFLADTDPRYTKAGQPYYDPARLFYHGNSQGGTIGNIVISMSTDITRALLGTPGVAFAFLVSRATQWETLGPIIEGGYPEKRDMQVLLGLVQSAFDRFEPAAFIRRATQDPPPGLPLHQVLIHVAKEDKQVHNDVSAMNARVAGAKLLQPSLRPMWGVSSVASPTMESAVVEFDFGLPENPNPNRPVSNPDDPHDWVRKDPVAQDQGFHFFDTGTIQDFCGGPCKRPH